MYKRFSDFYDQLVFDIDYDKYANNIVEAIIKNGKEEANILEIGCGTGNLTQKLADKANSIIAFDYSEEMLNHAFPKLIDKENVQILKYDMYKFPYHYYEFDAIISILDVMNYITDFNKLEKLFHKIYEGIKEGGLFIFDLNSRYKLLEVLGNNSYIYERENIFYTWENTLIDDQVHFDLNFFIEDEDGFYDRFQENQVEKYHELDKIVNLLKQIGFEQIEYFDEDGGEYIDGKTQRILIVAKK